VQSSLAWGASPRQNPFDRHASAKKPWARAYGVVGRWEDRDVGLCLLQRRDAALWIHYGKGDGVLEAGGKLPGRAECVNMGAASLQGSAHA